VQNIINIDGILWMEYRSDTVFIHHKIYLQDKCNKDKQANIYSRLIYIKYIYIRTDKHKYSCNNRIYANTQMMEHFFLSFSSVKI